MSALAISASTIDSDWPLEEPNAADEFEELDDATPLETDEDFGEALVPDDDYDPEPDPGDFWPETD